MLHGRNESGQEARPVELGLTTLARRGDLPLRARRVLGGLLALCQKTWPAWLEETAAAFEQRLFKRADQSGKEHEQRPSFETLREIKRTREEWGPRFLSALEDSLARFDHRARAGK